MSHGLVLITNSLLSNQLRIANKHKNTDFSDARIECICDLNKEVHPDFPSLMYRYFWLTNSDGGQSCYEKGYNFKSGKVDLEPLDCIPKNMWPEIKKAYKWIYTVVKETMDEGYDVYLCITNMHVHERFNAQEELKIEKLLNLSTSFDYLTLYKIIR